MPLPTAASVRDRTSEFLLIAERLSKQPGFAQQPGANGGGTSPAGPSTSSAGPPGIAGTRSIAQASEFSKKAADIGHGIHRTSAKLQRLAQLAKRTSAFDDPAQEVDELTGIIKQDITVLNTQIADLQRLSAKNKGAADGNKQIADHSLTVVDNLRSRLKDATAQFKDVLTQRTDSLKHHRERRALFTSSADPEAGMPLLARHRAAAANGSQGGFQTAAPSFLTGPTPQQQQQQQLALANPQDTYLSSRAEALRNVENTIVELGGIFNKLSELVAEQGELAIRIDENMDDTLHNVNSAQQQLLKYLHGLQNNRWLVLKVMGVLMLFLLLFVFFIA